MRETLTRHLLRFDCMIATVTVIIMSIHAPVGAQTLLPGEMNVSLGREILEPSQFPSVSEIAKRLAPPEPRAVITFRLYGDAHNHYAPQWSSDGHRMAALRSDINAHTSKVIVLPFLNSTKPSLIYPGVASYDHFFSWSQRSPNQFVLASTNEPSESENIHIGSIGDSLELRQLTRTKLSKMNPAIISDGTGHVIFSAAGSLKIQSPGSSDNVDKGQPATLTIGQGTEARSSMNGKLLAWVEHRPLSGSQGIYTLKMRDMQKKQDRRIVSLPGMSIRNPVWSPDDKYIAFYARPLNSARWRLMAITVPVLSASVQKPVELVSDVRTEEHFVDFGPSWSPDGSKLWYFSATSVEEHYPIQWVSVDGSNTGTVHYPEHITTALDLAVHPDSQVPAVAFCAIENLQQDIIVVLMNRH